MRAFSELTFQVAMRTGQAFFLAGAFLVAAFFLAAGAFLVAAFSLAAFFTAAGFLIAAAGFFAGAGFLAATAFFFAGAFFLGAGGGGAVASISASTVSSVGVPDTLATAGSASSTPRRGGSRACTT